MVRAKQRKAVRRVATNLLVWVDIEELGGGYADLSSGVG